MPQSTTPPTLARRPVPSAASNLFPGPTPSSADAPALDLRVADRIGDALRAHYRLLVSEPIPERFAELVGKLDGRKGR